MATRVIAVIARNTNLLGVRTPSRLEIAYLQSATDLARMITDGIFPYGGERLLSTTPRVGDGCIRVDRHGMVTFASPNALSAYRRMGLVTDLVGSRLKDVTGELLHTGHKVDDVLASVLTGRAAKEIEIENAEATLFLRAIPLRADGEHVGALILLRDVTELRSRERELVTKEATIREIHHRVKNNLQTVAALLRMQGTAHHCARRTSGLGRGGPPGRVDRDRARDTVGVVRRARGLRRRRGPGRGDGGRRVHGRHRRWRSGGPGASAYWTPKSPLRWRWC